MSIAHSSADKMHRIGHYGGSLLAYSPVGFLAVAIGAIELAIIGGAIAVAGAMVPDWDMRIPFVRHRGPTHTIWFALVVGIVLGVAGALVGSSTGAAGTVIFGVFGFAVGVTIVVGHLFADMLTPMGIEPFQPLRDDSYTLDVARAANPVANYALLVLGVVISVAAFAAGNLVSDLLGV